MTVWRSWRDRQRIRSVENQTFMNPCSRSSVVVRLAITIVLWLGTGMPAGADAETTAIMQHKLQYSQAVLRGIALQDFPLIQTNAVQLVKLSHLNGWQVNHSEEYALFSMEFRRHAESLAKAAKSRNIDAAALAYTQLTFSCVSCHKHLRGDTATRASLEWPRL